MRWIAIFALTAGCSQAETHHGAPVAGECRDPDGDGFGHYCPEGPDCDETDALVHEGCSGCGSRPEAGCPCDGDDTAECSSGKPLEDENGDEVCATGERHCIDGFWGECDYTDTFPVPGGQAAGGILGDVQGCSPCDLECWSVEDVPDENDLTDENSESLEYDPERGGLVISGSGGTVAAPYGWIANESNGTLSKIDQATGAEVGRYHTDESPYGPISPSRTAVDAAGNAYVGNRMITGGPTGWWGGSTRFGSVSKFAGTHAQCRNGARNTSKTSNPLPYGEDDCLLWTVRIGSKVGSMVRAVAISRGDDAHPDGYPWIGTTLDVDGAGLGRAYKLNPDTGAVLCSVALPISAYGATSDGQDPEKVWFSERLAGGRLVAVNVATCTLAGTYTNPDPWCGDNSPAYGIAVDGEGRIWQAGYQCGDARRFDPQTGQWCYVDVRGFGDAQGITVDVGRTVGAVTQPPRVWVAHYANPSHVSYWDADEACVPTNVCHQECSVYRANGQCQAWVNVCVNRNVIPAARTGSITLPNGHQGGWGIGVDGTAQGRVWIVPRTVNKISIFDPITGTTEWYPTTAANLQSPYTYSDFLGSQFRNFIAHEGYWRRQYGDPAVCEPGQLPSWQNVEWDAETPAGTHIRFEAQTALTEDGLDDAEVVDLGDVPPEASPPGIDIGAALVAAGVSDGLPFLRLRVVLVSDDRVTSPLLRSMEASWICRDAE